MDGGLSHGQVQAGDSDISPAPTWVELRLAGGHESNVSRTTAQPDACGYGEGARAAATPLEMQMQRRQEEEGTRGGDGGLHQGESTVSGR